jgi:APA family basic amino acid/polyamine antiporter
MGSTNGSVMAASRVYYAMSRDRLFFRWLDYIHPRFHTPSRAIIVHCVWACVILLVRGSFENIVAGMVFAILIFYAMTAIAMMRFRARDEGEANASLVPFYPWLPLIYLGGILLLLAVRAWYEWQKSLVDIAFVLTGIPFAFIWCRQRQKT